MLHGIQNFLQLINDNWTTIIVIIGLLIGLFKKIQGYLSKSDEEKIAREITQYYFDENAPSLQHHPQLKFFS